MVEKWVRVSDPAVEVSDLGRVRIGREILSLEISPEGHPFVVVDELWHFIALLVLTHFNRPARTYGARNFDVVAFVDGNRQNCSAANLWWEVRSPDSGDLTGRGRGAGRKLRNLTAETAPEGHFRKRKVPVSDDSKLEARRAARRRYYYRKLEEAKSRKGPQDT